MLNTTTVHTVGEKIICRTASQGSLTICRKDEEVTAKHGAVDGGQRVKSEIGWMSAGMLELFGYAMVEIDWEIVQKKDES